MKFGLQLNIKALSVGLSIWFLVSAGGMSWAFVASDGEPVCEGPLIFAVNDSAPPECADPIDGLMTAGPIVFLAGLVLVLAVVLAMKPTRIPFSETGE